MADETTPPTAPPPAIAIDWTQLAGAVWNILPTGILKTFLGVFLAIVAGTHYASSHVQGLLKESPKGIIEKILPPKFRPADAIGKIQVGNVGCTATIIGPVHDGDEHVDILTAAHCVNVGQKGRMTLKDGRVLNITCVTRNAKADVAWLRAERPGGFVPSLLLADVPPPPGTPVWHQGYGVDKPGNKEDGVVKGMTPDNSKVAFVLSVSHGDSGGGIICTQDDRVISPVCCTDALNAKGNVWGGAPAAAAAIRPRRQVSACEPPLTHPMLPLPHEAFEGEQTSFEEGGFQ